MQTPVAVSSDVSSDSQLCQITILHSGFRRSGTFRISTKDLRESSALEPSLLRHAISNHWITTRDRSLYFIFSIHRSPLPPSFPFFFSIFLCFVSRLSRASTFIPFALPFKSINLISFHLVSRKHLRAAFKVGSFEWLINLLRNFSLKF